MNQASRGWSKLWMAGWVGALCCGPVAAQTPTFSLWVTEVNGTACPSCPTQDLPASEVRQGDVIRLDAFVEGWDDDPAVGRCSGTGYNQVCLVGSSTCTGRHCSDSGSLCTSDTNCISRQCIPSTCIPWPQVSGGQWTIDAASYRSGSQGELAPARIPCDAADCANLLDGLCPCAHFHQFASECTCATPNSCQADGFCGRGASAFVEPTRTDFLFFGRQVLGPLVVTVGPDYEWAMILAGAHEPGAIDDNERKYFGTLLLTPSGDAAGTFTVRMVEEQVRTLLVDANAVEIGPANFEPAVIHLEPCCPGLDCDDGNGCTVDTLQCDTCTCEYSPLPCPQGQDCVDGTCIPCCIGVTCDDGDCCTSDWCECVDGAPVCVHGPHPCDLGQSCSPRTCACEACCPGTNCNDGNPNTIDIVDCATCTCLHEPGLLPAGPTFSLWAVEVNGVPCASCPTQDLPPDEVAPGDVIRVEAFVEGWDDSPTIGRCDSGPSCLLGQPDACTGRHCLGTSRACVRDSDCVASFCILDGCHVYPQVSAFEWRPNPTTFSSGGSGKISMASIACAADDCATGNLASCPCTQFYESAGDCTCVSQGSCLATGSCRVESSAFIELNRPDYLFFNRRQQALTQVLSVPAYPAFGASLLTFDEGIPDDGLRYYVGTMLLQPSPDASGTFTLDVLRSSLLDSPTYLGAPTGGHIKPLNIEPLRIHLPCREGFCNDGKPCTVDRCDAETQRCVYEPKVCPPGQVCMGGNCVPLMILPTHHAFELDGRPGPGGQSPTRGKAATEPRRSSTEPVEE